MTEFELGPSSLSTFQFTPNYIKDLLSESHTESDSEEQKSNHIQINPQKTYYSLRSNVSNRRSINRKSMSDHETMAFVALRDVLNIKCDKLAKLYNYNKREYGTFQAVLNNKNIIYKNWINADEVSILYHFFARISSKDAWTEICNDLGFAYFFHPNHIKELFSKIRNLQIRAKDGELFELRFFMKLLIFFWDNVSEIDLATRDMGGIHEVTDKTCNFAYFWVQSLSRMIQFISELRVGINIEVYAISKRQWTKATIIKINKSESQIYVQLLDGSNTHQWLSVFCDRFAPIQFEHYYVPNMNKRNNVPCIVSVIDPALSELAPKHVQKRNMKCGTEVNLNMNNFMPKEPRFKPQTSPATNSTAFRYIPPQNMCMNQQNTIPKQGWYYKAINNKECGPVTISGLFKACVRRDIDDNSIVYHQQFGTTQLNKLPHIIKAFRVHVQRCKQFINLHRTPQRKTAELSVYSTNSALFDANRSGSNLSLRYPNVKQ